MFYLLVLFENLLANKLAYEKSILYIYIDVKRFSVFLYRIFL